MPLVSLTDLRAHRNLSSILDILLDILRKNLAQVGLAHLLAHACQLHNLSVDQVIRYNLGHLGEVPAIPLLQSHCVVVDLLIQVIQQGDGLDDHDVDLLGRELELVPGETVSNTQSHHLQLILIIDIEQVGQIESDDPHELLNALVLLARDPEAISDKLTELLVGHSDAVPHLLLDNILVQELGQGFGDFALHELGDALEGICRAFELMEILESQAA